MGTRDARVDAYIATAQPFAQEILSHLREVVHSACPDTVEAVTWSRPFFTYKGALLCNMAAFKAHASFGFWLGRQVLGDAAADDGMGQFGKLTRVKDLPSPTTLTTYVRKAMALVDAGATPVQGSTVALNVSVPPELESALRAHPEAKAVFEAFPPSHRREYAEWIAEARRPETRERRVQQALGMLAEGKSRNWKYETKR